MTRGPLENELRTLMDDIQRRPGAVLVANDKVTLTARGAQKVAYVTTADEPTSLRTRIATFPRQRHFVILELFADHLGEVTQVVERRD